MNRFREHFLSRFLTLLTTLLFVNMSFFLAEVSLLELEKDGRFAKIITLIMSGTCFEEEKETSGDTSEEDTAAKKIEVVVHHHNHFSNYFEILSDSKWISDLSLPPGGIRETSTPPPKS